MKSGAKMRLYLLPLLLVTLVSGDSHISCWICGCPQENDSKIDLPPSSCSSTCDSPSDLGVPLKCESGACHTHTTNSGGEVIVQRRCSDNGRKMNKCHSLEVFSVQSTECQCDTHLCNTSVQHLSSKVSWLLLLLLVHVSSY